MGSHSIQFTVDVYTETGVMATVMLDEQWTVQACIHAGADMAPWYAGAMPTGMFGVALGLRGQQRLFYTVLNAINNAESNTSMCAACRPDTTTTTSFKAPGSTASPRGSSPRPKG